MAGCEIKCDNCGQILVYNSSDFIWDRVNSADRELGEENEYEAIIDNVCTCGQKINITFRCWEYPAGVKDYIEVEEHNGEIVATGCPSCPDFTACDDEDF